MKDFPKKLLAYFGFVGAIIACFAFEKITRDGVYEIISPWDQEWFSWKGIILLALLLPMPVFLFKWKEIKEYLEKEDDE
jgi:hypothetical protein